MDIMKKLILAMLSTIIILLIIIGVATGTTSFDILWSEVSADAKLIFIGLVIVGILS